MNKAAVHTADQQERGWEQTISQYAAHDRQLLRFCRKLTGSAWDAEDLAQTTWTKVWMTQLKRVNGDGKESDARAGSEAVLRGKWDAPVTSSYLYRIAANAWTDYCRRRKAQHQDRTERIDELAERIGADAPPVSADTLQDAMERLVVLLPPRQRIIVMLVDAMRFTSSEAAALLAMTEGAVKAALHRARETLSRARAEGDPARAGRRLPFGGKGAGGRRTADEAVVYAYLEAFRTRNVQGLLQLLNAETASDVLPAVQGIALAPIRANDAVRAVHGSAAMPGGSCFALAAA
ncbi:RNA polymerase sigma factor [Paenibacillus kobensis]|uniref:RNA polymerase sigma factor n=1 Tax=Paenibacillus kobensis TaxID=59841 RepID=UPI0013E2C34A|nr:sigma-70 family RNA polymerase sigma factor [Paenibacillus kobensis]